MEVGVFVYPELVSESFVAFSSYSLYLLLLCVPQKDAAAIWARAYLKKEKPIRKPVFFLLQRFFQPFVKLTLPNHAVLWF